MKKQLTVPETHQIRIALATLKMSEIGATITGGMNHQQAIRFLRSVGYHDQDLAARLRTFGHDDEAIARYMA